EMSKDVAIRWAGIAEKYGVEIFSPQNEFDNMIRYNFVEEFDDGEGLSLIVNSWHQEMLPEIRDVFSGVVMAKLANIRGSDDFTGYDLIGETVIHMGMHPRDFREHIKELYGISSEVAERSSAQWIVAEFWMPYSDEWWPPDYVSEGVDLDQMQDDYFRIAIEEYLAFDGYQPSGFIFISYALDGMGINERPAMGVVDDFFNGMHEAFEPKLLPELEDDYIQSSMPEGFFMAANDDTPFKNMQVFETGWMHWAYEDKHASTDDEMYEENFIWLKSIRDFMPEQYVTLRYVYTNTGDVPDDFGQYLKDEMDLFERFLKMAVDNGLYFDMCEFGDEFNLGGVLHLGFTEEEVLEYYYEGLTLIREYMPDAIICADVIDFLNLRVHPDQPTWHEMTGQVIDDVEFIERLIDMGAPLDAVGTEIQPGAHTYYDTDYIIGYLEEYRELGVEVYIWELWMLSESLVAPNEQEESIYGAHAPPGGYSEEWQADTLRTLLDYISLSGNVIGFNYMFVEDGKFYWSQPYMNGLIRPDGTYKEGFYVMLDWYLGD
ncbi:MAG: hypothetical protein JW825_02505, partial [Candidatus Methanofastidiosa archaeon]|nr:hypothetical protein [Candidatus Methanofastidiosa archaeon]